MSECAAAAASAEPGVKRDGEGEANSGGERRDVRAAASRDELLHNGWRDGGAVAVRGAWGDGGVYPGLGLRPNRAEFRRWPSGDINAERAADTGPLC